VKATKTFFRLDSDDIGEQMADVSKENILLVAEKEGCNANTNVGVMGGNRIQLSFRGIGKVEVRSHVGELILSRDVLTRVWL